MSSIESCKIVFFSRISIWKHQARLNLHILCNRNRIPHIKSDLDLYCRYIQFRLAGGEKIKDLKNCFLRLTKCQDMQCVRKELFFSFHIFNTMPYLSCCNHFWKFRVLLLRSRVYNVYFSCVCVALIKLELLADGRREKCRINRWRGNAFSFQCLLVVWRFSSNLSLPLNFL